MKPGGRSKGKKTPGKKLKNNQTEGDTRSKLQREKENNAEVQKQFVGKIPSPKGLEGWLFTCLKCNNKHFKGRIRATAHAKNCGGKIVRRRKKSQRKLNCNLCDHQETTKAALTRHRRLHHNARCSKYRCSKCLKQVISVASYKRHVARHGATNFFNCTSQNCGKKFTTKANLVRHRRTHLGKSSSVGVASFQPSSMAGVTFLPSSAGAPITPSTPPSSSSIGRDLTAADDQVALTLS